MEQSLPYELTSVVLRYDQGEAVKSSSDVVSTIETRYEKDETDEFLKPIVVGEGGRIKGSFYPINTALFDLYAYIAGDTLFFFNYRSDRMREIASLFGEPERPIDVSIPEDIVRD